MEQQGAVCLVSRPAPWKKGPTYDENRKESEERSGQTTASQDWG